MNFSISCDDCSQRCSTACDDCVVTFVLQTENALRLVSHPSMRRSSDGSVSNSITGQGSGLVLDLDERRALRWMSSAGLVPDLKFESAG